MSKKNNRFSRLEYGGLFGSGFFKKGPPRAGRFKRFEKLEVDGHKIKIEIAEDTQTASEIKQLLCPKCKETNHQENLRCVSCGYVFDQLEKNLPLKVYERRCPNCARVGNRSQETCYYCGQIFPLPKKEEIFREQKNAAAANLAEGETITLTIDGKTYQSTEENLPLDVGDLMLSIKRQGYSQELVDAWIKRRNYSSVNSELFRRESSDPAISALRLRLFLRALGLFGVVLLVVIVGFQFLIPFLNLLFK